MSAVTLPRLADLSDPNFDAFVMEKAMRGSYPDPYPVLEKLRQQGTVHKGELNALFAETPDVEMSPLSHYMVFGYDACMRVLMDPEHFTNKEVFQHNLGKAFGRTVTVMDGTEHQRYRRVLQKAFLPHIVAKWGESLVQPVIDKLMGQFIHRGKADLVEEYTHHFPFQIIYNMLRLEPEQAPIFHKLAVAQLLSAAGMPQGPEATQKLGEFFAVLLAQHRAHPDENLVSHLATIEVDGEFLDDDVLISFLRQLVNAGGDTTYRAMSVLITCLLNNPDQLDAVRKDRSLIPQAIEEALRWDGPVTQTFRYCIEDTEIDGVTIPAGTVVDVSLGSANRDPTKYDDPDRFDIFRERGKARLLTFAAGPHICVGQHLARIELTRALDAVLDLPNLRLDPDMPPPHIIGHFLRAPDHIHVLFDKA